jgi:hypothetical protein
MEPGTPTCKSRDLLSSPWRALVVFGMPAFAIVVAGSSGLSSSWRTVVWTAALGTMGAACIANAVRCRRVHCSITGPFFLVMAGVTLLYGVGVMPLGRNGWNLIGLTILAGGIVLCCLPEMLFGKYRTGSLQHGNQHDKAKVR